MTTYNVAGSALALFVGSLMLGNTVRGARLTIRWFVGLLVHPKESK